MSKEHKNPYREGGAYFKVFEAIRKAKNQTVTREELVAAGEQGGWSAHDVTVVLSPREVGKCRGNPAGNFSAQGEVYFMLPRKVKATFKKVDGKMTRIPGQPKTFQLRWRKEALEAHVRSVKETKKAKVTKAAKETRIEKTEAPEAPKVDTTAQPVEA
jgi:hypothetical protein